MISRTVHTLFLPTTILFLVACEDMLEGGGLDNSTLKERAFKKEIYNKLPLRVTVANGGGRGT